MRSSVTRSTGSRANSGRPESNGGAGAYSMRQLHGLRMVAAGDLGHHLEGHVDARRDAAAGEHVAVTDHARRIGVTPNSASWLRQAQWQAARLPRSRPAAASSSEPVHTEVT